MAQLPPTATCQLCESKAYFVFLSDRTGPVYHPMMLKDSLILALVGCDSPTYPDTLPYAVEGTAFWVCEKCLKENFCGKSNSA